MGSGITYGGTREGSEIKLKIQSLEKQYNLLISLHTYLEAIQQKHIYDIMEKITPDAFASMEQKTEMDSFVQKEINEIHSCEHRKIIKRLL